MNRCMTADTRRGFVALAGATILALACGPARVAAEPQAINPLPTPDFSIDLESPTLDNGVLLAADVLNKPGPMVVWPAGTLGMDALDDLNALSYNRGGVSPTQPFLILFGVDRASVGLTPPDPGLCAQNRCYNVVDQAAKHQAAGDIFMTLTPFTRSGPLPFDGFGPPPPPNNTLVKNQGDTGGVDKDLKPELSPELFGDPLEDIDDSDGIAEDEGGGSPFAPRAGPGNQNVLFFSATRESTLPNPPVTPSGANIYGVLVPDGEVFLYAGSTQLGLVPGPLGDDIDSLIVFDNGDLIFGPQDTVIFSLTRESPSLDQFDLSPAHLLRAQAGTQPVVYAEPNLLGLGPMDNVDALEIRPTNNVFQEVFERAIFKVLPGDYNGDGLLNIIDCNAFDTCYSGPGVTYDDNGIVTHAVAVGPGPVFNPASLVIEAGDVVQWIWQDGPHNVVSGPPGAYDGVFHSGSPVSPPHIFTVAFDAVLLDVHPKYQGRYRYFSAPDLALGMLGQIDVDDHPCATFDFDGDGDVDSVDYFWFRDLAALHGAPCPMLTIPEFVAATLGTPFLPGHAALADMNGDGNNDGLDVPLYVDALLP
jgi:plastocyanin